jgi:hypothetical protein
MALDYRIAPLNRLMHALEPERVDCVLDAMGGASICLCVNAARAVAQWLAMDSPCNY